MNWLTRLFRRPRTDPSRIRPGGFICDRHWDEITASWETNDPIDAAGVTLGLTMACHLVGMEAGPVRHACCLMNVKGWQGLLARCRPSVYAK